MTDTPIADTATDQGVLTRDDLTALKLADAVTFHHLPTGEGGPKIRLYLENRMSDEPRIFTAAQQRAFPAADGRDGRGRMREIPVESSAFGYDTDSATGWRSDDTPHLSCFHMIHSAQFTECWPTIARLLKAGDRLELRWVADNNTGTITEAGLHYDQLRLHVHRSAGPLVLAIATSVSPDNTARMIRRQGGF